MDPVGQLRPHQAPARRHRQVGGAGSSLAHQRADPEPCRASAVAVPPLLASSLHAPHRDTAQITDLRDAGATSWSSSARAARPVAETEKTIYAAAGRRSSPTAMARSSLTSRSALCRRVGAHRAAGRRHAPADQGPAPGRPAQRNAAGRWQHPRESTARCPPHSIMSGSGDRVWLDDGKIGGPSAANDGDLIAGRSRRCRRPEGGCAPRRASTCRTPTSISAR